MSPPPPPSLLCLGRGSTEAQTEEGRQPSGVGRAHPWTSTAVGGRSRLEQVSPAPAQSPVQKVARQRVWGGGGGGGLSWALVDPSTQTRADRLTHPTRPQRAWNREHSVWANPQLCTPHPQSFWRGAWGLSILRLPEPFIKGTFWDGAGLAKRTSPQDPVRIPWRCSYGSGCPKCSHWVGCWLPLSPSIFLSILAPIRGSAHTDTTYLHTALKPVNHTTQW